MVYATHLKRTIDEYKIKCGAKMQLNPLWPVTYRFPKLEKDITVDVAIAGGGIAGISSAYHLTKAGYKVALLEKDEIGSAATGASSGVLFYGTGTDYIPAIKLFGKDKATMMWKETAGAIEDIVATVHKYNIDCGLRRCGSIMVAKTNEELETLSSENEALGSVGIDTKIVTNDQIKEYFTPSQFLGGLSYDACSQIHPAQFASALAKESDINVYEHSKVTNWIEENDKVVLQTDNAKVTCSKLIFATNLQPYFDLKEHFDQESSVILASQPLEDIAKIWPQEKIIWTMDENYDLIYLRGDRAILELYRLPGNKQKLAYYYPNVDFKADKTWGDSWAKPKDWLPIVGRISNNIALSIGMGDQGIIMGWLSGRHMSGVIEGKSDWFLDMTSHNRFH